MKYKTRVIDNQVKKTLKSSGAIVIEGPKASGKTMTGQHFAESSYTLDGSKRQTEMAEMDPGKVLEGEIPRLIDEWQFAPDLWNIVRHEVDRRQEKGQFILTGSSFPPDDLTRHSGAGRFRRLRMRPMSLWESGHSTGIFSLSAFINSEIKEYFGESEQTISNLVELTCIGGWPGNLGLDTDMALDENISYIDEISRTDIKQLDGFSKNDPNNIHRLLSSIARNTATMATQEKLARETFVSDEESLSNKSVHKYLNALERLMIYEPLPAWSTHIRSKSKLQIKPKIHFVDPSIGVAALKLSPEMFLDDLEAYGFFFESLVVRDLRIYADAHNATLHHYRDNKNLEADIIIQTRKGWIPVEVKLSDSQAETASKTLDRVIENVEQKNNSNGKCLGKLVITAGKYSYYNKNTNTYVVPLACLKD